MRQRILIIYTGGTIGMIEDIKTGALMPFDFTHLIESVPKVKMLNFDIDNVQFEQPIDSSDMNPAHWSQITRIIADNYEKYDGFVVLHGTDTMAYTASVLSFMLEGLNKPVIITGSQLPIGEVRTDGEENLITALQIAAARDEHKRPIVREVAILFDDYLWRGNRASKQSSDNFDAFKSSNYPPLAKIGLGINFNYDALLRHSEKIPFTPHFDLDTNVSVVDIFPGMSEQTLRHMLGAPGVKGVVLRTFGAGNCPTVSWFREAIEETVKRGAVVLNVTQCHNGFVHPRLYLAGKLLANTGIVPGHDITVEAAVTKMMYLFGRGYDAVEVREQLRRSLAGEVSATPVYSHA